MSVRSLTGRVLVDELGLDGDGALYDPAAHVHAVTQVDAMRVIRSCRSGAKREAGRVGQMKTPQNMDIEGAFRFHLN